MFSVIPPTLAAVSKGFLLRRSKNREHIFCSRFLLSLSKNSALNYAEAAYFKQLLKKRAKMR